MTSPANRRDYPFWTYEDLALFLGAALPSFLLAALLVRAAAFPSVAIKTLTFQSLVYALLLGTLYLVISWRYGKPFWRSLNWTGGFRGAWLCVVAGPALAIVSAVLAMILRAPAVPSPIESFISGRASLVIVMLFLTIFGPLFEELLFRGFLFPLVARSLGAWPGILLTAALFALLHGSQNHWTWQDLVVIGVAGTVFGYARYKTGSTAASTFVHAGYNLTLFVGFIGQKWL